jgi:O-antigen/teichoic acid export membrane protein
MTEANPGELAPPVIGAELGATKRAAMRLSAQMGAARLFGAALSVASRVVGAGALGPSNYGVLRLADVVQQYSGYAEMGARYAVARQVPILLGQGDEDEARLVSGMVLIWMVTVSIVFCLALWLMFALGIRLNGLLTIWNLVFLSGLILLNRLNAFLGNYVRAYGNFDALGIQSFILAIGTPVVSIPAILWWGVAGGLLAQMIIAGLVGANLIYFGARLGLFRLELRLPIRKAFRLLRLGLLLHFNNLSESLFETLELTLLAIFASTQQVGLYGFAIGWVASTTVILTGVGLVTERAMLLERGAQGADIRRDAFRRYLETPLVVYLLFASGMLGITYFVFDFIVKIYLPEFAPAMLIAQVLIFGQTIYSATELPRMYFNVTDQLKGRLGLALIGITVNVILDLFFLWRGYGAVGVAVGSSLSYCLYAAVVFQSCASQLYGRRSAGLRFLIQLALAAGVLALLLNAQSQWNPTGPGAGQTLLVRASIEGLVTGAKTLVYCSAAILLYLAIFRSYHPRQEIARLLDYALGAVRKGLAVPMGRRL